MYPIYSTSLRIAVITPCWNVPSRWLNQCRQSVLAQGVPCTHIFVNDGGQAPQVDDSGPVQVVHLPQPHQDVGNAGRAIGSVTAICQGFEALVYLDADNWFEPNHLETLVALHHATGAAVCTSARNLYRPDGQLLGRCPEVDGIRFVDTNCLFLTAASFPAVASWYLAPRGQALAADRVFWQTIKNMKLRCTHSGLPTVAYRTNYQAHYDYFGVAAPPDAKVVVWDPVLQRLVHRHPG